MATSPQVLASLNEDLAREHGAIMRCSSTPCSCATPPNDQVKRGTRGDVALQWLAEAIRDHRGASRARTRALFVAASPHRAFGADVATEAEALSHYESTLQVLGNSDWSCAPSSSACMDDERRPTPPTSSGSAGAGGGGRRGRVRGDLRIQPPDLAVVGPAVAWGRAQASAGPPGQSTAAGTARSRRTTSSSPSRRCATPVGRCILVAGTVCRTSSTCPRNRSRGSARARGDGARAEGRSGRRDLLRLEGAGRGEPGAARRC